MESHVSVCSIYNFNIVHSSIHLNACQNCGFLSWVSISNTKTMCRYDHVPKSNRTQRISSNLELQARRSCILSPFFACFKSFLRCYFAFMTVSLLHILFLFRVCSFCSFCSFEWKIFGVDRIHLRKNFKDFENLEKY